MPRLRIVNEIVDEHDSIPLRFPVESVKGGDSRQHNAGSAEDVLEALENVSRRIDDLARELNCLGWFDDDDRPRAA